MSHGDRRPRPTLQGGRRLYRFLRSIPTWVLWLLVVVWMHPDARPAGQLVPRPATQQRPAGGGPCFRGNLGRPHARQLPRRSSARASTGGMKRGADQLVRHRPPGDDHPDRHSPPSPPTRFAWIDFRGRQGLFIGTVALLAIPLQVALIPLLQLYVSGAHSRSRGSTRRSRSSPTSTSPARRPRSGSPTPAFAHAVRHLPAAQLHLVAAQGPLRGGADRRRRPLQDLLAARAAAVGARCSPRSRSSSSCGPGTTTSSPSR